jgi:hypothetical protein
MHMKLLSHFLERFIVAKQRVGIEYFFMHTEHREGRMRINDEKRMDQQRP